MKESLIRLLFPHYQNMEHEICDRYLCIMFFLFPLFLSDELLWMGGTAKEFCFIVLTWGTYAFSWVLNWKSRLRNRNRILKIDIIFLCSIFLCIVGVVFDLRNRGLELIVLMTFLILFFLMRFYKSEGEAIFFYRGFMYSSLIVNVEILLYSFWEVTDILGVKSLLNCPEAAASWMILSATLSSAIYLFYSTKINLTICILNFSILFIWGDFVTICIVGLFLLSTPVVLSPTVSAVKRNLYLCFSFIMIGCNMPLLMYIVERGEYTYDVSYGCMMIEASLLCVCIAIKRYWRKVPVDRDPRCVVMKKFQLYYKRVTFIVGCIILSYIISLGKVAEDIDQKFNLIHYLGIKFKEVILTNESVFFQLTHIGFIFWAFIMMTVLKYIKKNWHEMSDESKISALITGVFFVKSFFYKIQVISDPIFVLISAFNIVDYFYARGWIIRNE